MNKAPFILLFSAWVALSAVARAADSLVVFPTGNIACTMDIVDHNAPPPSRAEGSQDKSPAVPQKAEIARAGELLYIKITLSNGKVREIWQPGKFALTFLREPDTPRLKVRRGDDFLPPVYHLDRKRIWFEWIANDCLKEEVTYRGVKCNRYEKTVVLAAEVPGGQPRSVVFQAWIDAKTRLPVAFDDEECRYEISFNGESPPLELPPSVQHELKIYQALLSPAQRR